MNGWVCVDFRLVLYIQALSAMLHFVSKLLNLLIFNAVHHSQRPPARPIILTHSSSPLIFTLLLWMADPRYLNSIFTISTPHTFCLAPTPIPLLSAAPVQAHVHLCYTAVTCLCTRTGWSYRTVCLVQSSFSITLFYCHLCLSASCPFSHRPGFLPEVLCYFSHFILHMSSTAWVLVLCWCLDLSRVQC